MFTVNKNPSTQDLRGFGWAMLAGFGILGCAVWGIAWYGAEDRAFLAWVGDRRQIAVLVLWGLGILLLTIAHGPASLSRRVYVVWMTGATKIGLVMSTLLLTLLFVLLLPVFSLIVRLGDPLRKRLSSGPTYWEDYKPHETTLERTERPF